MTAASYDTAIRAFGNNAGIEVPAEVLTKLGAGKRPKVLVTVGDYSFATTVGAMGGLALISLSKAHREASGLRAGQNWTQPHPASLSRRSWLPHLLKHGSFKHSTNWPRLGARNMPDRSLKRKQTK